MSEKVVRLVLPGPPRTKKNSQRIAPISFVKNGKKMRVYRIQPSKAYERWFKNLLTYSLVYRQQLSSILPLPLANDFNLGMAVYLKDERRGDLVGYQESVLDALQAPVWRKKVEENYGIKTEKLVKKRDGIGIYQDDAQCIGTDGCRIAGVDSRRPRIEVVLTFYGEPRKYVELADSQGNLFDDEEDEF